jgi:hypothetical protein
MKTNPLGWIILLGGAVAVAAFLIQFTVRLFRRAIDSSVKRHLSRKA